MATTLPWTQYEDFVEQWARGLVGDSVRVERNVRMPGRLSGVDRQVDVRLTGEFAGEAVGAMTAIVDAKYRRRNVNVNEVAAFAALIEDVGADVGVVVTNRGFSPAARTLAGERRIRLHI